MWLHLIAILYKIVYLLAIYLFLELLLVKFTQSS